MPDTQVLALVGGIVYVAASLVLWRLLLKDPPPMAPRRHRAPRVAPPGGAPRRRGGRGPGRAPAARHPRVLHRGGDAPGRLRGHRRRAGGGGAPAAPGGQTSPRA